MYETFDRETRYRIFDDTEDLIATVQSIPDDSSRLEPIHIVDREHWIGRDFHDWEEVYAAARSPWPEGVEIVERMAEELADADLPQPQNTRRKPRFSEDNGDEVDYDRLRSGQPFWRTTQRANTRGPQVVTLVVDLNAAQKIAHHDILWRGAAVLAMTRILEDAGFRVEIWTIHCAQKCYSDGTGHCHAVCLKRPGDPLNVGTLVSAVSGWFYRTVGFRAKALGRKPKKSLGTPHVPRYCDTETVFAGYDDYIVIGGAYSYGGAVYLARRALEKLAGVEPPPPPPLPADYTPPRPLTAAEQKAADEAAEKAYREWKAQQVEQ